MKMIVPTNRRELLQFVPVGWYENRSNLLAYRPVCNNPKFSRTRATGHYSVSFSLALLLPATLGASSKQDRLFCTGSRNKIFRLFFGGGGDRSIALVVVVVFDKLLLLLLL
jgi:hypothetical protein